MMMMMKIISIPFVFTNVPSQQPDGQLQKPHTIQTPITKDNKQDTYETNTYKTRE
jgi:hypothetical protein